MSAEIYDHTKLMIAEYVSFKTDSFKATLLRSNYQFFGEHRSFAQVQGLAASTIDITLTSTNIGRYRLYVADMTFPAVTDTVGAIVLYPNATKGNVDRPLLFHIGLEESDLVSSDFVLSWTTPLLQW